MVDVEQVKEFVKLHIKAIGHEIAISSDRDLVVRLLRKLEYARSYLSVIEDNILIPEGVGNDTRTNQ